MNEEAFRYEWWKESIEIGTAQDVEKGIWSALVFKLSQSEKIKGSVDGAPFSEGSLSAMNLLFPTRQNLEDLISIYSLGIHGFCQ